MRLLQIPYNTDNITGSLPIPVLSSFETHMLVKVQTNESYKILNLEGAYSKDAYDFNNEWKLKNTGDEAKWLRVYTQLENSNETQRINLITVDGKLYLWRNNCYVISVMKYLHKTDLIADVWQLQLFPEDPDYQEYYGRDLLMTTDEDTSGSQIGDIASNIPIQNISQALKERLATSKGELPEHPLYGSELYKLIGSKSLAGIEAEAEFYVADAIYQDPRVDEITMNRVRLSEDGKYLIIELKVKPIYNNEQLNIVYYYWLTEA